MSEIVITGFSEEQPQHLRAEVHQRPPREVDYLELTDPATAGVIIAIGVIGIGGSIALSINKRRTNSPQQ